ncbi:hypothetical protein QBC35DRAFT_456441 [Podospora australis]|uniref:Uncharacterized protein n=1 Tax=Podospora australis TaxID=1536484 RepID=A0AAN7ADK7_9PEZI|nr:hypothetical protein QBC35DRAFT_456441 [Podospora australis]
MSDHTEECMLRNGASIFYDGMHSVDTYNGIMGFFANECGTFKPQFKEIVSQTIEYTVRYTFTASIPTATGNSIIPTSGPSSNQAGSFPDTPEGDNTAKDGLKLGEILGIAASIATVVGLVVTIYMCRFRGR